MLTEADLVKFTRLSELELPDALKELDRLIRAKRCEVHGIGNCEAKCCEADIMNRNLIPLKFIEWCQQLKDNRINEITLWKYIERDIKGVSNDRTD